MNEMYAKKKEMDLYTQKAEAIWVNRLENLNIDSTNIMITTVADGIVLEEGDDTFAKPPSKIFEIVDETIVKNKDGTSTVTMIQGTTKKVTTIGLDGRSKTETTVVAAGETSDGIEKFKPDPKEVPTTLIAKPVTDFTTVR